MTAGVEHTDVGAYALGLLTPGDAKAFEDHLAACRRCAGELGDFAGMADLLTGLGPVEDTPHAAPEGEITDLTRHRDTPSGTGRPGQGVPRGGIGRPGQSGRGVRRTRLLLAAAAAALFAGGVLVGTTRGGEPIPADLHGWGEIRSATDERSGLEAVAAVQSKGWGTHVALDLGNLKGPLTCRLVAVSATGAESEVTGWAVPVRGYGAIDSSDHLQVHGGIAIPRGELDRLVVRADGVGDLLTIPT
ncbi:anti-sigma factor family protein [Actinomadura sp. 9N215]|uniref:anti-sigma factor family protein n=1 Tax=Actinomadura sp. 9N215 TaxID=3375150 RepID=UPI0037AEE49D